METLEISMAERGQIVIPKKARDALGLRPGVKMELRVQGQTLVIQKSVKLDLSRWIGYAADDAATAEQDLAVLRGRPVPWTGGVADKALLNMPYADALQAMAVAPSAVQRKAKSNSHVATRTVAGAAPRKPARKAKA